MADQLPLLTANGLLMLADPHFAATPPGQRREGYLDQVLEKVRTAMEQAVERDLVVVFLGDLFHWPRDNPNNLLVALIELFGSFGRRHRKPWALVGNHDKYQANYTSDVSLAVLEAAGVVEVISKAGEQFLLQAPGKRLLLGASPDFTPVPSRHEKAGEDVTLWITHHNVGFPDVENKRVRVRELPGVDWVVNGHIHRPQPVQVRGCTRWVNAGGLVRMQFSRYNLERRPSAVVWTPECEEKGELERWEVPIRPFWEVFPDQELPQEEVKPEIDQSLFVAGLERLAWRRTQEGLGLRQFLDKNLQDPDSPEQQLVWRLYEEVVGGEQDGK